MLGRLILLGLVASSLSVPSLQAEVHVYRKRAPSVAPVDELEILDPLTDPEGKPKAIIVADGNGVQHLEVPPTVIIHKHYYTGSRNFQGPMIQGGLVLVVVRHPATGEQVYVELQLPPGAPRIFYKEDSIVYQYRDNRITLCFGRPGWLGQLGKPAVSISARSAHVTALQKHVKAKDEKCNVWLDRAGIPECLAECRKSAAGTVQSTAHIVKVGGTIAATPIRVVRDNTPIGGFLGADN